MSDTNRVSNQSIKKIAPVAVSAFAALLLVGAASNQAFAIASLDLDCTQTVTKSSGACGFVGKGDVQNAFSPTWNNAQLQDRATAVDFVYEEEATYSVMIQWTSDNPSRTGGEDCVENTGPGLPFICTETHDATQTKTSSIDATVNADPRKSPKQFTGFLLTDVTTTESGDVPEVGDSCPNGSNNDCVVTSVEQTGSGDSTFRAVWNGQESNPIAVTIL